MDSKHLQSWTGTSDPFQFVRKYFQVHKPQAKAKVECKFVNSVVHKLQFLVCFIYFYRMRFKKSFFKNLSSGYAQNRMSLLIECIVKLIEMFTLVLNTNGLIKWLNNWRPFEYDFWVTFSRIQNPLKFDIRRYRNILLIFYVILPTIVWVCTYFIGIRPVYEFYSEFMGEIVCFMTVLLMASNSFTEDTKLFVMLKTIQLTFEQV
jgi:hypothetical protein